MIIMWYFIIGAIVSVITNVMYGITRPDEFRECVRRFSYWAGTIVMAILWPWLIVSIVIAFKDFRFK